MLSDDFGLFVKPLKLPWGGVLEPNFPEKSAAAGSTARSALWVIVEDGKSEF